jgi:hypothetical protein
MFAQPKVKAALVAAEWPAQAGQEAPVEWAAQAERLARAEWPALADRMARAAVTRSLTAVAIAEWHQAPAMARAR